jgi:hypothetical protein
VAEDIRRVAALDLSAPCPWLLWTAKGVEAMETPSVDGGSKKILKN